MATQHLWSVDVKAELCRNPDFCRLVKEERVECLDSVQGYDSKSSLVMRYPSVKVEGQGRGVLGSTTYDSSPMIYCSRCLGGRS